MLSTLIRRPMLAAIPAVIALFAMVADSPRADQTIPAGEYAGGTWGAGEVITVEGSITIIGFVAAEPGSTVKVAAGAEIVIGTGGFLLVDALGGAPVLFTSAQPSPQPGDWVGIRAAQGSTGSIKGATIEYAQIGLLVENTSPTIQGCVIRKIRGISGQAGPSPEVAGEDGRIGVGIWVVGASAAIITDCVIEDIEGGHGGDGVAGFGGVAGTDGTQGTVGANGDNGAHGDSCSADGCTAGDGSDGEDGGIGGAGGMGTDGTSGGNAGDAGKGAPGVGIYLQEVVVPGLEIKRNVIARVSGGDGGNGGAGGGGGAGGKGGRGGAGGRGGEGGNGGDVVPEFVGTGGDGGVGGQGGEGGEGGWGGRGGDGTSGGAANKGGLAAGLYASNCTLQILAQNLIVHDIRSGLTGMPGAAGIGGAAGSAGQGGASGSVGNGGIGGSGGAGGTDGEHGDEGWPNIDGLPGQPGLAGVNGSPGNSAGGTLACGILYENTRGTLLHVTVNKVVSDAVSAASGIRVSFAAAAASLPLLDVRNSTVSSVSGSAASAYGMSATRPLEGQLANCNILVANVSSNFSWANPVFQFTPSFVNAVAGDYHLRSDSPLIGRAGASGVTDDYEGEARDEAPDIGADEYVFYDGRAVGDFNGDHCTGIDDFLFLLDNWQAAPPGGGDVIGIDDFLSLLDNWQAGMAC